MSRPTYSFEQPSGAIRFGFDDGTTLDLPPTDSALALHAQLPDSLEGATAATDEERIRAAMGAAAPPPVRSDAASPAGPISTVNAAPAPRAAPPPVADTSRIEGAIASQMPAGAPARGPVVAGPIQTIETRLPPESEFGAPLAEPASPPRRYIPPTTIPGGPRTAGWNYGYTQTHPEVEGLRLDAAERVDMAEQMELAAKQERSRTENLNASIANRIREDQETELEEQRQRHLEAKRAASDSLYRTQQRIEEMAPDPDRWWSDKSAGQRIGLAIAVALGELGASLTGRKNAVQEMIQTEIDRDIDSQKAKIAQSNKAYEDQKGLYAEMLAIHKDEQDATLATRAAFEDMVARGLEQRAAKLGDAEYAAEAMRQASAAREREAAILDQLHQKKVAEQVVNVPDRVVGGGWVGGPGGGAGGFDPDDPTAGMSKEDAVLYRKASDELAKYAGTLNDIESAKDAVSSSGGAGLGIVGSKAPREVLSGEGVRVRGSVDNAMIRYGKEVLGSMTAEEREIAGDILKGRGTEGDVMHGLNTASSGTRAVATLNLRKYPKHIQDALRRSNPNLFEPTVRGKAPGQ
jgi:hypothetical protein